MGRIDFPPEGFEDFKKYVGQYIGKGKMKLLLTPKGEAILRTKLATRYDSAYITGLSHEQQQKLEQFVGTDPAVWWVSRFFWDEEIKEKAVEKEEK